MKSKIFSLLIVSLLIVSSCGNNPSSSDKKQSKTETKDTIVIMNTTLAFAPDSLAEEPIFDIKTSEGTIRVRLYKETPLHRDNFIKLASEKYYDGILFHRVIRNFMIQVGDPLTKDPSKAKLYGTGGPGYTIKAEILPQFHHKKGALAAARRGDAANPKKESSGSQFYIVESAETCAQLDGEYTIFGETVSGFDVIDKIANVPTKADRPIQDISIISITPVK